MGPINENNEQADLLGEKMKSDADAKVKSDAGAKVEADADAKVKADADAKVKADADAKAKADADAKAKAKAETEKPKKSSVDASVGAAIGRLADGLLALFSLVAELAFAAGHAKLRDRVLQKKEELEK